MAHMLAVQIYKREENVKQLAQRLADVVKSNMDFLSGKQKRQSIRRYRTDPPANISKINVFTGMCSMRSMQEYDIWWQ